MRPQPSTSTSSSSLNGRETVTGGSIIMPIDMSAADTTRSMTRNGTKMTKPMMKADRSSDSMNAGMSVRVGTDSGFSGLGRSAARVISARSSSRVWPSMNSRSGPTPVSTAWVNVSAPLR